MKLSNKILLGFFGFAFLYLTAAFAELRLSGTPNVIDKENSIAETINLSGGIAYLVINGIEREVQVIASDRHQIEVRSFSGDVLKKLTYKASGDTLTLSGFESEDTRAVRIAILVPNSSLKAVSVKSSTVIIEGLEQEQLNISEDNGRVWMSDNILSKIEIDLSNKSLLDISATVVDNLSATIDQSEVRISTPVGLVQGSMKNNSMLHINQLEEIQLKKDASSTLTMYQ